MLCPTQTCLFGSFVGIERDPQLTVDLPTESGRHNQLRAVLQLQFVGHQHTHFVREDFIKLLEARQNREVQHHQISRHQADEQQGDDEQ